MSFLRKLFGSKKEAENPIEGLVKETLNGIIESAHFDISFKINVQKEEDGDSTLSIEFSGADEELFKERKGQLLDSFQLFIKRVVQHNFPDDRTNITVDSGGYREETEQALIERAENLKAIAIEQGKSVYYRALPPKDRKVVHQYLAKDPRVKSRSLGEGLFKKIKIYPVKSQSNEANDEASTQD